MARSGILFVASGPSGTGKTTLCRMVEKALSISHSVSVTTRPARVSEQEGKDYFFVDEERFQAMIERGEFLEWAEVHGHRYGTPRTFIEKSKALGQDVILDLDTQGAISVKGQDPQSVLIFIDAPDAALAERLGKRATEDPEKRERRLKQAALEREAKSKYDYIIVNEDLETSYQVLTTLIEKERLKREKP